LKFKLAISTGSTGDIFTIKQNNKKKKWQFSRKQTISLLSNKLSVINNLGGSDFFNKK